MICSNCGAQGIRRDRRCPACGYDSPFKMKRPSIYAAVIGPDDDMRSMIEDYVEHLISSQERPEPSVQ